MIILNQTTKNMPSYGRKQGMSKIHYMVWWKISMNQDMDAVKQLVYLGNIRYWIDIEREKKNVWEKTANSRIKKILDSKICFTKNVYTPHSLK